MHKLRARAGELTGAAELVQRTLAANLPGHSIGGFIEGVLARALPSARTPTAPWPACGRTLQSTYSDAAGSRPYELFLPDAPAKAPALIVMLHGCTQTAADFAAGTQMNAAAAEIGALVLYPVQVPSANVQRCWNWFNPADRQRDGGEAALIAGMTRQVAAEHGVHPSRIFVAGLSAGGAQAAALGAAYPDLFAAVGVHSGLACGAASDMGQAFAAMRQARPGAGQHRMRTIIFHGDRDTTVNAANADAVEAQVAETASGGEDVEHGVAEGGLSFTRTVRRDAAGRPAIERWIVHGAGHAWSGGSAEGSYTEPRGPDASRAMVRFFLG